MSTLLFRACCAAVLLAAAASPIRGSAQSALDNRAIIQMTKAGLGDSLIVESINATPANYSTAPADLIALKQAGVSERVIKAVIAKASVTNTVINPSNAGPESLRGAVPASAAASVDLTGVDELGVYYKDHDGKWTKMEPELVNYRSGGALKSYATNHVIKEDRNGHLMGESARLVLAKPTDFLLYMPAGTDPVEYLLLKLRPGGQHGREFRSETGGVFHSSSGATRDEIAFTAIKVAPHVYQFTLPASAGKGEYGILPPGSMSAANAGSGGKIYTFKILDSRP
jgi:hypothetical protein